MAAQPVTDTIKESADGRLIRAHAGPFEIVGGADAADVSRGGHPPRAGRGAAQELIFTDDTAACELIGQPVRLVSQRAPNPKVTVPGDLPFIEVLAESEDVIDASAQNNGVLPH